MLSRKLEIDSVRVENIAVLVSIIYTKSGTYISTQLVLGNIFLNNEIKQHRDAVEQVCQDAFTSDLPMTLYSSLLKGLETLKYTLENLIKNRT